MEKNDKDNINKHIVTIKNYDKNTSLQILAQEDYISYISLNNDGTLLATANEKGTIIKIHSCKNGNLLSQFYRGKEKAEINCICFDKLNNFLAVTSDRGTVHIWSLGGIVDKIKNIEIELREDKEKKEDEKNDNEIKIKIINENNDKEIKNEINIIENLPRNKKVMFGQT